MSAAHGTGEVTEDTGASFEKGRETEVVSHIGIEGRGVSSTWYLDDQARDPSHPRVLEAAISSSIVQTAGIC